jgi:hypothetical protein
MSQLRNRELRPSRFSTNYNQILSYLFSGGLWVLGSLIYLSTISEEWWKYRDDSVIHLSQARNFSLFGTIGLSAGDRVEAMSSPLNFAISWLTFGINPNISYQRYLDVFVLITLFALSVSINLLLVTAFRQKFTKFTGHVMFANFLIFSLTISSWTTFGWLVSGMENILCVIIFLFLLSNLLSEQVNLRWTIILFTLLGVCRIELAALIAPILLFTASRITKEKKSKIFLVSIPLVVWLFIHCIRFWYFGHLLPNTATALNKNLSFLTVIFLGIQYVILSSMILRQSNSAIRYKNPWNLVGLTWLVGLGVWRIDASSYSTMNKVALISSLIAIISLVFAFQFTPNRNWQIQLLFLVSLIPVNHYFLFGPARLSAFRIVGIFVIPILSLLMIFSYSKLTMVFNENKKLFLVLAVFALACLAISKIDQPRNLCCAISPSESYISKVAQKIFGREDQEYPLPIVANPDLGKASFSKDFMNVDLGLIGEPLLAKITLNSPDLVDEYLVDIVVPDVIELHGHWSCVYEGVLKNPKFRAEWKLSWSGYVSSEMSSRNNTSCPRKGKYSIWKRSIPQNERLLSQSIAKETFREYSEKIRLELENCTRNARDCEIVSRAVIRNKAKLIESGTLEKTVKLLEGTKSYEFASLRILQPRAWDTKALSLVDKILMKDFS